MGDITMVVTEAIKAGLLDVEGHANTVEGDDAVTDNFFMPNDGKTVLVAVCGAAPKLITFTAVADRYGRTETLTVQPTADKTTVTGPFLPELWNNAAHQIVFKPAAGGLSTDLYLAVRVGTPT